MEWYMRVYKFGPYLGLPEKGVGARGGLSLLQADVDFLDDAEFLALGRIASRGLTVARVHNQKDLDVLQTHELEKATELIAKHVQHLASDCLRAGALSPADLQGLGIGGPWMSPSLAILTPLSSAEMAALNAVTQGKHADATAEETHEELQNSRALNRQALAAARAAKRSKLQTGRTAGSKGPHSKTGGLDESHDILDRAEEETQGVEEPGRGLYLRAVAMGPRAFRNTTDHKSSAMSIRDLLLRTGRIFAQRQLRVADQLPPDSVATIRGCGPGAELLWRADLAGKELAQLLIELSAHEQRKHWNFRRTEDLSQWVKSLLADYPLTVRLPTFADFQHLAHQLAVINEDMQELSHLTLCVPATSNSLQKHTAGSRPGGAVFPLAVEIHQPLWRILKGPALSTISWPTSLPTAAVVERVCLAARGEQGSQPVLEHASDEGTWVGVLGFLASLHIGNQVWWHDDYNLMFVIHAVPVLKGGRWGAVSSGKARRAAAPAVAAGDGFQAVQLRLGPQEYKEEHMLRLVAYQQLLEAHSCRREAMPSKGR